MNYILIHNLSALYQHQSVFNIDNSLKFPDIKEEDADIKIDDFLNENKEILQKVNYLFIKYDLTDNYGELMGLRVAHHIRLNKKIGSACLLPIIFIGDESPLQILKLTKLGTILTSNAIFNVRDNIDDIKEFIKLLPDLSPLEDISDYLTKITIPPPDNYNTHHSIANEWAIYRLYCLLEKDESNLALKNLKDTFRDNIFFKSLYFKYLDARQQRQEFSKKHLYPVKIDNIDRKKICFIDDDINKGWGDLLSYIMEKSNVIFSVSDFLKKEFTQEQIIEKTSDWIKSEYPDVCIIDLRLHENDFSENDNLTGLTICENIQKINPGIQIVILTASNKIWNYKKSLKLGIFNYVIKESPEYFYDRDASRLIFIEFSRSIKEACRKSYLKDIYSKICEIKDYCIRYKDSKTLSDEEADFYSRLINKNGWMDQIFELLILDDKKMSKQCLLIFFHILENLCDVYYKSVGSSGLVKLLNNTDFDVLKGGSGNSKLSYIEFIKGKFSFQTSSHPINKEVKFHTSFQQLTLNNEPDKVTIIKLSSILKYRYNIQVEDINKIIEYRYLRSNLCAHETGNISSDKVVEEKDIMKLIDLLLNIFR